MGWGGGITLGSGGVIYQAHEDTETQGGNRPPQGHSRVSRAQALTLELYLPLMSVKTIGRASAPGHTLPLPPLWSSHGSTIAVFPQLNPDHLGEISCPVS